MEDDEDHDALAGEYVLGTLSAEERAHAEGLLAFDPAFEAAVRQWERRLGELNVMVEAVEPPVDVWDKVKTQINSTEPGSEIEFPGELPPAANLAADFPPPEHDAEQAAPPPIPLSVAAPPPAPAEARIQRGADVIYLANQVRRWRHVSYGVGAIAALLALYIAVWQVAPELMPRQLRPAGGMIARSDSGARAPEDRLVAVLQAGPTGPAFLLTLDTQQRTLTVRRVSAQPEAGKSYELWLIASRGGAPRSLGVVGNDEFTQRAIARSYDVDTLRGATYAVSLEPAGGSPSGAPTGPVLFTGKAVESLPASAPQTPKT